MAYGRSPGPSKANRSPRNFAKDKEALCRRLISMEQVLLAWIDNGSSDHQIMYDSVY